MTKVIMLLYCCLFLVAPNNRRCTDTRELRTDRTTWFLRSSKYFVKHVLHYVRYR